MYRLSQILIVAAVLVVIASLPEYDMIYPQFFQTLNVDGLKVMFVVETGLFFGFAALAILAEAFGTGQSIWRILDEIE